MVDPFILQMWKVQKAYDWGKYNLLMAKIEVTPHTLCLTTHYSIIFYVNLVYLDLALLQFIKYLLYAKHSEKKTGGRNMSDLPQILFRRRWRLNTK